MVERNSPLVVEDADLEPGLPQLVELPDSPFRSWASAPVMLAPRNSPLAFLCLQKKEPHFYHAEQVELLALFAAQAALALQNARLFHQTLESLDREQILNEMTRAISSNLDLPTILQSAVRVACELAGAEAGALALQNSDASEITYPYLYNLPIALSMEPEPQGASLAWEVCNTRQSLVLED